MYIIYRLTHRFGGDVCSKYFSVRSERSKNLENTPLGLWHVLIWEVFQVVISFTELVSGPTHQLIYIDVCIYMLMSLNINIHLYELEYQAGLVSMTFKKF